MPCKNQACRCTFGRPISDRFAIGFRDPSLYSVLFEYSNLNREFSQKYGDTIQLMPYIDNIYFITLDLVDLEALLGSSFHLIFTSFILA